MAYDRCCGRLLAGAPVPTAELLTRSRFTAYARQDEAHLLASWHSSTRPSLVPFHAGLRWTRLHVVATTGGGLLDTVGTVHFRATSVRLGVAGVIEERSRFSREDGRWAYVTAEG